MLGLVLDLKDEAFGKKARSCEERQMVVVIKAVLYIDSQVHPRISANRINEVYVCFDRSTFK